MVHGTGWMRKKGRGGTRCPKGVFRNRGKMEENRYSLVAGKSRVERAEREGVRGRGAGGVETPPVERGRFVRTHTEVHAHMLSWPAYMHTCDTRMYTHIHRYTHRFTRPSDV